ncbi:MAG: hypothetical protein KTR20_07210 [Cellvibrionaceae bacterium]|nr:hypothetical protein [Cellvibrionaceae bacterium]
MSAVVLLGFALGLLHALDADHVMAVSALSNQNPSTRRTLLFSLHWALGHGGILLGCGMVIFGLGLSIPSGLQALAEVLAGLLLASLGLGFFWRAHKHSLRLRRHRHRHIVHTHWVTAAHAEDDRPDALLTRHQPVLFGGLHGLAGSAPALALIPTVNAGQGLLALAYLASFSLGVMLSMLAFGLGFSWLQTHLYRCFQGVFRVFRYLVALGAIAVGGLLVWQTL